MSIIASRFYVEVVVEVVAQHGTKDFELLAYRVGHISLGLGGLAEIFERGLALPVVL